MFLSRIAVTALLLLGGFFSASGQAYLQVNDSFPNLNTSAAAWGDIDNDGDMDLALIGTLGQNTPYSGIWVNNGNNSFSELPSSNFTTLFTQMRAYTPNSLDWGDYNNDGRIDLAMVGYNGSTNYLQIWRNDGNNMFFPSFDLFPGKYSAVKWGDADNDGDQDLVMIGESDLNGGSLIAFNNHNAGATTFTSGTDTFPHFARGAVDFGDYDNDGDLDLIMAGYLDGIGSQPTTQLWDNDGTGDFTQSNFNLTGLGWGDLEWNDTDCDGDLDLMMTGFSPSTDIPYSGLLLNSGTPVNRFDTASVGMIDAGYSSVSMGDYDHDGYPDLVIQGDTTGQQQPASEVRRFNPSLKVFFLDNSVMIQPLSQGDLYWIDYDRDGDLDIFSGGLNNSTATNLYENTDTAIVNQPPAAPTGLAGTTISTDALEWTWTAATDDVTPAAGLSYRMIIERQSDFFLLTPPLSDIGTERQTVSEWGTIKGTSWVQRDVDLGETYCAAVIAVDGGLAASEWSASACASVVVGMDDAQNPYTINAWPTPATTVLNVSLKGLQGKGQLKVTSLDGRTLRTEQFTQLDHYSVDVSGLAQGIYLLTVQVDAQSAPLTLRFVKN
ncbi:MAG: T9SS type A sorting domain-containing protein [Bacteroidota bacterium]